MVTFSYDFDGMQHSLGAYTFCQSSGLIVSLDKTNMIVMRSSNYPHSPIPMLMYKGEHLPFCVRVGYKIWKNGLVDKMQHTCFMMHH